MAWIRSCNLIAISPSPSAQLNRGRLPVLINNGGVAVGVPPQRLSGASRHPGCPDEGVALRPIPSPSFANHAASAVLVASSYVSDLMQRDRVGHDRLDGRNRDFLAGAQRIRPVWATAPKQADIVRATEALYVVDHIGNRDHLAFTFSPSLDEAAGALSNIAAAKRSR